MYRTHLSRHVSRLKNSLVALLFVGTQVVAPLALSGTANATSTPAPSITVSNHEGQLYPSLTYTGGNITTYREGDTIKFHFTISSASAAAGQMQVLFTNDGGGCNFFDGTFVLNEPTNASGTSPTVTTIGSPTAVTTGPNSGDWSQVLATTFTAAGQETVNYTLKLTTEAGKCGGSSQHSRLGNVAGSSSGDFANIGAQNVPVPAQDILILPSITISKAISQGTAKPSDFSFTISPAINGTSHYTIPVGSSSVLIDNIPTDGVYTITESTVSGYTFTGGTGTNCVTDLSTVSTAAGTMTATVAARKSTATNATCAFTNTHPPDSLTVVKQVDNHNGGNNTADSFGVLVNGTQLTGGTLSNSNMTDTYNFANPQDNTPYSVSETSPTASGYAQTSIVCTDNKSKAAVANPVVLSSGQNVTCVITNNDIAPTLTIVKNVANNNVGTATANKFVMRVNGTALTGGTLSNSDQTDTYVYSGASANTIYAVSEDNFSNYSAGSWVCTDNATHAVVNNPVTLNEGQNVTCSITNTRDVGTVTVNKTIFPSTDTGLFNLSITGPTNSTTANQTNGGTTGAKTVATGTYTVSETAGTSTTLGNYASNYSCSDGATVIATGSTTTSSQFTVASGHNIVCTFTNTRLVSISGTKYEANADGTTVGTTGLSGWEITLYQNSVKVGSSTFTDASGNYSFTGLLPGSYNVLETLVGGWTPIYSPSNITLSAGQTATSKNFGNFANATISGYKFNDLNGSHTADLTEPGLSGWTITLYDNGGSGTALTHQVKQTVTAVSGAYSFTNLPPKDYKICETAQTGWTQTYPTTVDGCQLVPVTLSGHNYINTNFGNRGHGTIAVVKNVDTDGNGTVDQTDVTNWGWDINGTGGYATGSTNSQLVPAGTYTVSEEQKTDYHVSASSCTDNNNHTLSTSQSVTVAANDDIVCTFTNTRDTAHITVNKTINPAKDDGLFNLIIAGNTNFTASDQGDKGTTGSVLVQTGSYTVSETAGTGKLMSDYRSAYSCDNGSAGNGTSVSFSVATNENVSCRFTNTRLANLTIVKDALPSDQQDFNFHLGNTINSVIALVNVNTNNASATDFTLDDDAGAVGANSTYDNSKQFTQLAPGDYTVSEDAVSGWDLTKIDCGNGFKITQNGSSASFTLSPGDDVTCTYTNTKRGSITIVKDAQPDSSQAFTFEGNLTGEDTPNFTLIDNGVHPELASKVFANLTAGTYTATESNVKGWDLKSVTCVGGSDAKGLNRTANIKLQPGENVTCTFVNGAIAPKLTVIKHVVNTNGNNKSASDFIMHVTGSGVANPVFTGSETGTTTTLGVGDYQVTEDNLPGYTATYSPECTGAVALGDDVTCTVTNTSNADVINLAKTNDRPAPTVDGDTVTYTLVVTVPDTSGAVFDTAVTDLPPSNFTYIPGSWTATSDVPTHNVAANVVSGSPTGEPTYGSPGVWHLGNLVPGEKITLTYKAKIGAIVSPGTYPDLAFVKGHTAPVTTSATVLGNRSFSSTPFVRTQVTVAIVTAPKVFTAGQVLGAEILVNTGTNLLFAQFALPLVLVAGVGIARRATHYKENGGK